MPTVGTGKNAKHYDYSPAGVKAAKKDAASKGLPIKMRKLSDSKPKKGK